MAGASFGTPHPVDMTVVVHWPRFGPLHLNRLRAAHTVLSAHHMDVVALEVASDDAIYDWRPETGPTLFRRETLFPGQNYNSLSARTLSQAMHHALDRLDPAAVAIHSYSTPDALAALSWCRRHCRVAVCMAESTASDAPRVAWREALKRRLIAQFDSALASGSASLRYHASMGIPRERMFVGYSVVDNELFAQAAAEVRAHPESVQHLPGLNDPTPFFYASARFMPRKDLPTLLHAYADYRDHAEAPWRLVLLGDGAQRPELEALLAQRGGDGVTLGGWQHIDTLPAYYGLASAFVHTALVDQWGLVVNEAMAAGLPVLVSTGAGCHEDLVREGENGYTFAPGDRRRLAELLGRMAHHSDLVVLSAHSRRIIAEFPLERFGAGLLAAVQAGQPHAGHHRRLWTADALTSILRRLARSPQSFHSVDW